MIACHVCGEPELELFPGYSRFHRVTSDCKPLPRGGSLALCHSCGCVQKLTDAVWMAEADKIYDAYSIYSESGGTEQSVIDQSTGRSTPRSLQILNCIDRVVVLPKTGKHLDIGCGNGALLQQFHDRYPGWSLSGMELTGKYKDKVEAIPKVQEMYIGNNPDVIDNTFECITMIHVLEHITNPKEYLKKVHTLLARESVLIIEVPSFIQNPYELLVADHCTHFTESSLNLLLKRAGFESIWSSASRVPKELTVIARRRHDKILDHSPALNNEKTSNNIRSSFDWLDSNIKDATDYGENRYLGILGTTISATWLFSEVSKSVHFFMDEDPERVGKRHLDRPVYDPDHAPQFSIIFLPFIPEQAQQIKDRLGKRWEKFDFVFSDGRKRGGK